MKKPKVNVGILSEPQIEFNLPDYHRMFGTYCSGVVTYSTIVSGRQTATYQEGQILWNGRLFDDLVFYPIYDDTDVFELLNVAIGIHFHWERREDQRFLGALKIIVTDDRLTAINEINVEDYLVSVISSEMSATASVELLKAHAVISRSWLLSMDNSMQRKADKDNSAAQHSAANCQLSTVNSQLSWYERDSHQHFDVCADDHCQRYQGITRATTPQVAEAVSATRGQVLMFAGKICDARFSKCCGGALEEFRYCWADVDHPYLRKQRDCKAVTTLPDLTREEEAEAWIRTSPTAFCHTTDKHILSQVLNSYDQETTDFYRWKVSYTQAELSALILQRSGVDYGEIIDLIPIARGTSGRLWKLKIVGTKQTLIIGKELEIRRTLSPTHLYSSAFVVDKEDISPEGIPGRFILTGAGWGHGVGLCQIGAAVMAEQGYDYKDILQHYYPGAKIKVVDDISTYKL